MRGFPLILTICGVIYSCSLFLYYFGTHEDYDSPRRGIITRTSKPTILFYGNWWQDKYPYLDTANELCPRCYFTQDPTFFDREETKAIVFHGRKLHYDVPPRGSKIWVFMLFEALNLKDPPHKWGNIPLYNGLFNWTLSYRRDSDVWVPYGRFISHKVQPRPSFNATWAYIQGALGGDTYTNVVWEETPSVQNFHQKRMVAWIVSRCESDNHREDIVASLRSFGITIDIYGPCGNFACDIPKSLALTGVDCRVQIASKYKFYLAFENSNCLDYTTEKFFDTVGVTEMVAVVFGDRDYSGYPAKSYINVRDFADMASLAKHLMDVGSSEELWLQYFAWRKEFWVQTNRFVRGWCDLCDKVLKDKREIQVYDKIWEWWIRRKDGELACK